MRYFMALCLTLACAAGAAFAFQGERRDPARCVVTPSDQILLAVASQPDSPLVFEDVKFLSCLGRRGADSYRLRNRGTKPIRSYTIAQWTSHASGYKSGWEATAPGEFIMPGQFAPTKEQEVEVVPLTKDVRDKLQLNGPLKGVLVWMVLSVEYADGTTYSDETTSKALEAYFEKVGAKIH